MIILGIDPGLATTGYGVIDCIGNKISPIDFGCIRTEADLSLALRLSEIFLQTEELIERYAPEEVAIERLFFNSNAKTAFSVGQARGVVLLAMARSNLVIADYTPLEVKQSVVGYGRAEKRQVQEMVKTILNLSVTPRPDDASDALAVAICHFHSRKMKSLK
ncbi:MAG: crossover junction endodeoxyribonuclease RuvC [Actinomycetota bacterium]|nr:crossover junction endodeoxyribonuclease RuvC [Actinomycetota bacterium]